MSSEAGGGARRRTIDFVSRLLGTLFESPTALLVAFSFAVIGDPVSSVAYAIEAALRELHGDLSLLIVTMGLVLGVIGLIALNYHQLYARFPEGGGDAAATGAAFGDGWAFLPLGSLIVDYALTITISVAAGASAIIAYFPELASFRIPLALGLLLLVAGLTWFGHEGRTVFATMTMAFVLVAAFVLIHGFVSPATHGSAPLNPAGHDEAAPLSVLLAFSVAMALATGVEAPSSAIAQLGQLDDRGRVRFGRITLWLMLGVVGSLTIGFSVLAVSLRIGIPPADSTQMSEIARASVGNGGILAAFQIVTAVLLLAAASSSFQAGPGLLKALAPGTGGAGILPRPLAKVNSRYTPYWGVVVFLGVSAALVVAAGAREQRLVLFYAVAVFVAFLCGLLSMVRFFRAERRYRLMITSTVGAVAVAVTLAVDVARGYPMVSLFVALLVAGVLHAQWVRAGRPDGVALVRR